MEYVGNVAFIAASQVAGGMGKLLEVVAHKCLPETVCSLVFFACSCIALHISRGQAY